LIETARTAIKGNKQCDAVTRADLPPDKTIKSYQNETTPLKRAAPEPEIITPHKSALCKSPLQRRLFWKKTS